MKLYLLYSRYNLGCKGTREIGDKRRTRKAKAKDKAGRNGKFSSKHLRLQEARLQGP